MRISEYHKSHIMKTPRNREKIISKTLEKLRVLIIHRFGIRDLLLGFRRGSGLYRKPGYYLH